MSYSPTQFEIAAGRMVDAALPTQSTPSRLERIAEFEDAQNELAFLCQGALLEQSGGNEIHYSAIVPLGIFATRTALESFITSDRVGHEIAGGVAHELQELCSHLRPRIKVSQKDGLALGYAAELGVANMLWAGIFEQDLGLNYCFLMGVSGYDRRHAGLKRDVDLVVKANEGYKHVRRKVQIKASTKRARSIYDDDIIVVTAQDLVKTRDPVDAVVKLLDWNNVDSTQRASTFRAFEDKLSLKRK